VTPALESSCRKRACKEEVGGDSGRDEDDHCSPRLEPVAGETRTEDLAHPEVSPNIVPHPAAAPENDSAPAAETTPVGVATFPPPATEGATAGDDAASHAAGATEEASVRARSLELPGPTAQAPSNLEPISSVQDEVPAAGTRAGATADFPLLGLVPSSGEASRGLLTTRVTRSARGDDSPAPAVVIKGVPSGKALIAMAESSIGSLSSASRLQQE
jgi:hypothetical protein